MSETIFHYLSYLVPTNLPAFLLFPKFFIGVVGIFFLTFVIFALIRTSFLGYLFLLDIREILTYRAFGLQKVTSNWARMISRLDTGLESEYKLAIIEAETLLDNALVRLGFPGENLADRLKRLTSTVLPNIEELKAAHMLRDNIVHDPNFILSLDQARKTMASYEKALRDLDLI